MSQSTTTEARVPTTAAGTIRLTTAQAITRYLAAQHSVRDGRRRRLIPAMLGIFGHGNVAGLGQALDEYQAELPFVQGRNEQSLVHIASGYAKANRRTAALAVTASIGPGAANMVTGAALATVNRLPVLLFPGDTYATRRQGPVLQQLEHATEGDVSVNDCFRPVARFFDRITRPEQLLTALPEAMRVLTSPAETGAVVIALPQDIQTEAYDFPAAFFEPRDWPIYRAAPHPDQIAAVAELIAAAEQPLIIAGGGVLYSQAEGELAALAEQLGIPVVETFAGKGAVQQDVWWGMGGVGLEGNPAANALAKAADLVIHVGTRLTDFTTGSQSVFEHPDVRFASINVVDRDARKQGATPVLADAKLALAALRAATQHVAPREAWGERARSEKQAWLPVRAAALASSAGDAHQPGGADRRAQRVGAARRHDHRRRGRPSRRPAEGLGRDRRAALPPRVRLLVHGLRAARDARGAARAGRRGEVIALIGDGTFLMQPTELATAAQEGLKVTVVVSDNHGYQVIRRLQMHATGRHFGNEMRYRVGSLGAGPLEGDYVRLDLVSVARGLGATVFAAGTRDEVLDALARARETDGPVVIVVPTAPHENLPASGVWWDVAPAAVSSQPWLEEKREAYQAGLATQRWHG